MANFDSLKTSVNQVIKTNGNEEITGQVMQNILNTIISTIGANKQFVGLATPATVPGNPDGNVFYLTSTPGTYVNFSGLVVNPGEISILWNGTANWGKLIVASLLQTEGTDQSKGMSQKAVTDSINRVLNYVNSKPIIFTGIPVVREQSVNINYPLLNGRTYKIKVTPHGIVTFNVRGNRADGTFVNLYATDTSERTIVPNEDFAYMSIYFGVGSDASGATVDVSVQTDFTVNGLSNYVLKDTLFQPTVDEVVVLNTTLGSLRTSGVASQSPADYLRTSISNNAPAYMLNIVRDGRKYKVSTIIDNSGAAGVLYFSSAMALVGSDCTVLGTYVGKELAPPENAAYAGFCGKGGFTVYQTQNKIKTALLPSPTDNIKYVDGSVATTGTGGKTSPYKTISEAITAISTLGTGTVVIAGGDYREQLNLGSLVSGTYKIISKDSNRVRILGSNKLSGWGKTGGYTNVYEIAFTGTVPAWSRAANPIFEDGRPSKLIEPRHYHPLQKNLTHRLPFTPIFLTDSIASVDSTPGTYFISDGKMYLHTSDSNNPETNGFSYENIARAFNTAINGTTQPEKVELEMFKIQFMYGTSFNAIGFYKMKRMFCVSMACNSAGAWRNDTGYIETWYEEAAFCNGDGENSHFTSNTNYPTFTDNRSFSPTVIHNYLWTHDNYDDGESSHEMHNVLLNGGLFEFNGDSGSRPSNDATYNGFNCLFRNNGWEVGTGITRGGEGFAPVNPKSSNPNTVGCRAVLFNCVSEENNIGYSVISANTNILELVNCISRNNKSAELYAGLGNIISRNTRATNIDPAKLKVVNTGTIEVLNDSILA